jgi:hypothetical protein
MIYGEFVRRGLAERDRVAYPRLLLGQGRVNDGGSSGPCRRSDTTRARALTIHRMHHSGHLPTQGQSRCHQKSWALIGTPLPVGASSVVLAAPILVYHCDSSMSEQLGARALLPALLPESVSTENGNTAGR